MTSKITFFSLLLVFSTGAFAQTTITSGNWEEALAEAKSQQKHLVVYFFAEGWQAPNTFETLLPAHRVIKQYLAKDYLVFNVDADTAWGRPIAEQYNTLDLYPSITLVHNNGNMLGYTSLINAQVHDYLAFFLETDLMHDRRQYAGR